MPVDVSIVATLAVSIHGIIIFTKKQYRAHYGYRIHVDVFMILLVVGAIMAIVLLSDTYTVRKFKKLEDTFSITEMMTNISSLFIAWV